MRAQHAGENEPGIMDADFRLKRAAEADIGYLVSVRKKVLSVVETPAGQVDMEALQKNTAAYYEKALSDGSMTFLLAESGGRKVGSGAICYYAVMPTFHNLTGRKGFIMNIYVEPAYRRRGIAISIVDALVLDASRRGVQEIGLEATDMGRFVYSKYGFQSSDNTLILQGCSGCGSYCLHKGCEDFEGGAGI